MHLELHSEKDLTEANMKKLDKLINQENTVILIHATWCGHCVMFKPQWQIFKKSVGHAFNVVEIESTALNKLKENTQLYKRLFGMQGVYFPMLLLFKKVEGKAKSVKKLYEDERSAEKLATVAEKLFKKAPVRKTKTASLKKK